jgi:hypothetical protein
MESLLASVPRSWFYDLTGFNEHTFGSRQEDLRHVYENLSYNPYLNELTSRPTERRFKCGTFKASSQTDLMSEAMNLGWQDEDDCRVSTIMADVTDLHKDISNAGSVFQVASQFNALEMIGPSILPSSGISRYENDLTQGPACAMACGAGTIFRNYFLQTDDTQINMAEDMLPSYKDGDWGIYSNGYLMIRPNVLSQILRINHSTPGYTFEPFNRIKVGVQKNTAVTLAGCNHNVTQVYCSALPISYYDYNNDDLHLFGKYVLESAYKSTLSVAHINYRKHGVPEVFLTLLGGEAFGNKFDCIMQAMCDAISTMVKGNNLHIKIVCFRPDIQQRVDAYLKECLLPNYLNLGK